MKSFRLIQFTDTHLFGDTTATLRGVACLPALRAAMADARSRSRNVDAVLLTGDLVQDDPEGYSLVREAFGKSEAPVLCLAGNHDLPDQMQTELANAPFQVGGELELGRWLVIALNTWKPHSASGRIGPEQMDRLRQTLSSHRNHHVLICLHHHPIAMQSRWLDQVGLDDAEEFMSIMPTCVACCGDTCINRSTVSCMACASWHRLQPARSSFLTVMTSPSTIVRPVIDCSN
jgi:Icc protein